MRQQIPLTVARILLGGVFLVSGVMKLLSSAQASEFLFQITSIDLSISSSLVFLFSCLEIVIALLLLLGNRFLPMAALGSSFFLLLFTFAGFASTDGNASCGCFGDTIDSKVDEMFIVKNLVLLGLSMFVLKGSTETRVDVHRREE